MKKSFLLFLLFTVTIFSKGFEAYTEVNDPEYSIVYETGSIQYDNDFIEAGKYKVIENDQIAYADINKKSAKIVTYSKDNNKKLFEYNYKNNLANGKWIKYDKNEKIKSISHYKNGNMMKEDTYVNGTLIKIKSFPNGVPLY